MFTYPVSFNKNTLIVSGPNDTWHTSALDMDGSTEYMIRSTLSDYSIGSTWTTSIRFNPDTLTGNKWLSEFAPSAGLTNRIAILIWGTESDGDPSNAPYNKIRIDLGNSSGSKFKEYHTSLGIVSGMPNHFLVTRDGTNFRLYVNGIEDTAIYKPTDSNGTMTNTNRKLSIGASAGGGAPFDGRFSRMDMWSSALTPNEVTAIYNAGSGCGIDYSENFGNYSSASQVAFSCPLGKNPLNVGEDVQGSNDMTGINLSDLDILVFPRNALLDDMRNYRAFDSEVIDTLGNNNGTATDITYNTTTNKLGTASAQFNGSSSKIELASPLDPGSDDFTFAFWFKGASENKQIFSNGRASPYWRVTTRPGNLLRFDPYDGSANPHVTTVAGYDDGIWHLCVVKRSGNTFSIRVDDATPVTTTTTTGSLSGSSISEFGVRNGTGWYDGEIDSAGYRTYALESRQEDFLYSAGVGMLFSDFDGSPSISRDGLLHEYLMEGGADDSAGTFDLSTTNVTFATPEDGRRQVAVFNGSAYTDDGEMSALYKTNDYTISLCFKIDVNATSQALLSHTNSSTDRMSIIIRDTDTLCCGHYTGAWKAKSTALGGFDDTTRFHHLIMSFDASTLTTTMYLDGVEQTGTTNSSTSTTPGFNLGVLTNLVLNLDGSIQRLRVYDTVVNATIRDELLADARYRTNTP